MRFLPGIPVTLLCFICLLLCNEVLRVVIRSREDSQRVSEYEMHRLRGEVARLESLKASEKLTAYVAEAETWRPEASRLEGGWDVRWLRQQQEWRAQLADRYAVDPEDYDWGMPSNRDRSVREVWLAQAGVLYPRIWEALPQLPQVRCSVEMAGPTNLRLITWEVHFRGETPDLARLESALRASPLKVVVTALEVASVAPEKGLLQSDESQFVVRFVTLPPEAYW
ncbi:MAG: hypothetical protein Q7P63_04075 [Verrucomicrobiota bacterium JB022]|nr:hypothetical protein [Verrucomicrobiota bacterium JB022]